MARPREHDPVIYAYLKKYQEDPTSRVFAPLAEAYRKAGLVDEAIEIAREGLRIHSQFAGGKVALARALFDKGRFEEVVEELRPVVRDIPDNLIAQRLVAESSLMLGCVSDALTAYKMLLYFNPQDSETAQMVRELEVQAYASGALVLRTDPKPEAVPSFDIKPAVSAIEEDPDVKVGQWIGKVEKLQELLLRVERYRSRHVATS